MSLPRFILMLLLAGWFGFGLSTLPVSAQNRSGNPTPAPHSPQTSAARDHNPAPEAITDQQIVFELRELVKAVNSLKEQQQAQVAVSYLQSQQARLTILEDQLVKKRDLVKDLKFKQQYNAQRINNMQAELISHNILNQSEGERLIKAEIEAEANRLQLELAEAETQLAAKQQEYDQVKTDADKINTQIWNYLNPTKPNEGEQENK